MTLRISPTPTPTPTRYAWGDFAWSYGDVSEYFNCRPWRKLLGPCPRCGWPTVEYGLAYSCRNDGCPNAAHIFAVGPDPAPKWWNKGVHVFPDGSAWCAVGAGFMNLQESDAGFGDTPNLAVQDLESKGGLRHTAAPISP